ncbi:lmo0937 family membrane protein [Bacillus sp. JJ664]|nr:lmo0937 family membrane protein [Gottfriedia solisilvae]
MWALFIILLVLWLLGFFVFHITGWLIHLVLIIAIIVFLVRLFKRKT